MFASINRPGLRGGAVEHGADMRKLTPLCAFLLAACGDSGTAPNQQQIEDAEAKVRDSLRDPQSALFSDVRISPVSAVCGFVNSRNGFGGMSGKRRFIVISNPYLEDQFDPANGIFDRMWKESCDSNVDELIDSTHLNRPKAVEKTTG